MMSQRFFCLERKEILTPFPLLTKYTRYSLLVTRYSLLVTRYSLLATRYSLLAMSQFLSLPSKLLIPPQTIKSAPLWTLNLRKTH